MDKSDKLFCGLIGTMVVCAVIAVIGMSIMSVDYTYGGLGDEHVVSTKDFKILDEDWGNGFVYGVANNGDTVRVTTKHNIEHHILYSSNFVCDSVPARNVHMKHVKNSHSCTYSWRKAYFGKY